MNNTLRRLHRLHFLHSIHEIAFIFAENEDTLSGHDNDTLRASDTAPLTYSSVANVVPFINDEDTFGNVQKIATFEDITVVGEEEIVIGTVVEDASSEGLKCIKIFEEIEEMLVQRNEDSIVEEGFQLVSVEDVSEDESNEETNHYYDNK